MTSSPETLEKWESLLIGAGTVTARRMMGEYIIYVDGKIIGGIYDDRFLLKITKASATVFREASSATPYEGGSEMILLGESTDPDILKNAVLGMLAELPEPKKRK